MDMPLEEAVKIKVSVASSWVTLSMLLVRMFWDSTELATMGEKLSES